MDPTQEIMALFTFAKNELGTLVFAQDGSLSYAPPAIHIFRYRAEQVLYELGWTQKQVEDAEIGKKFPEEILSMLEAADLYKSTPKP